MKWKLLKFFLILMLVGLVFGSGNSKPAMAEEKPLLLPAPADCSTCCKKVNLYPGIDVNNLMQIKYIIKYTKFAKDQESVGNNIMIDRSGLKRTRKWHRYRVILEKDGIDYKDLMVLTEPQHIKGLAVLTWMYLDPNRERDNWLWLPSQRKLRRVSPAEDDEAAFGADLTTEELTTRNWNDETYAYINENGKFEGYTSQYNKKKTYYQDALGWVVEAKPKRKDWYYSRRVLFIPNNIGAQVHDDIFDPNGQKYKDLLRVYEIRDNGCIPMTYVECTDHRTNHMTAIEFDWIKLNTGVDEKLLSPKALMRSKW
ncbi:MAG TPA: outer membrane lipoprotein-sorting protein [Thermodesulfobacteriota bacterium]|nr:outer membrane lipoprotein-sorting protein [Thermodesulfobacteriota bacterium]